MLKHLTDEQLLKDIKTSVCKERAATLQVLEHIQEVHRRKLFAELGYPSLFKYLVAELKYSESQAYRRIQAARLVAQLPEVKVKIANGALNLSKASQLQSFFNETKVSTPEQKIKVLAQVEHTTTRECELLLEQLKNPNHAPSFSLQLKLSQVQKGKWDALADRLAHHKFSKEALLERALELALKELDPAKEKRKYTKKSASDQKNRPAFSRTIPAQIKRQVFQRAQGRCEWKCHNQRCCSTHALQVDHIMAYALGGEAVLPNLQLLCLAHHQRKTVQEWGRRGPQGCLLIENY